MIGQTVANHEITALLGEGGMGSVYVAEHPILKRKVAIKLLRRELTEDRSLVQRFINEARVASAIRHRNVIEIADVGMTPAGTPYILMEFLEGESLGDRIKRQGKLRPAEAIELACQAADALAAAHAKGVIHRDLKPENLFIVPDPVAPGRDLLKVLDFGIAKLRDGWSGADAVKTGTGSLIGTPPYMAPEQCRGLHEEIDARSDIYALGTIIFEMLCGQPPFTAKGWGEVLLKHMTEPPPLPSSLNPTLPPHLDEVILRMLAKDKASRYPDMREVRLALDAGRTVTGFAPASATVLQPLADSHLATAATRSAGTGTPGVVAEGGMTTLSGASGMVDGGEDDEAMRTVAVGSSKKRVAMAGGVVAALAIAAAIVVIGRSSPSGESNTGTNGSPAVEARPVVQPPPAVEPVVAPVEQRAPVTEPALPPPGSPVVAAPESASRESKRGTKKVRPDKGPAAKTPVPAESAPQPVAAPPLQPVTPLPATEPPAPVPPAATQKKKNDKLW